MMRKLQLSKLNYLSGHMRGKLDRINPDDKTRIPYYCHTSGSSFVISSKENGQKHVSSIQLSTIHNVVPDFSVCKYCFKVQLVTNNVLYFVASSLDEMQQWIVELLKEPPSKPITFADFEFVKPIYQGEHSDVAVIRGKDSDKLYCLKSIRKNSVKGTPHRAFAERNVLMKTRHVFICHLFSTFQSERAYHFIMCYMERGTLADVIRSKVALSVYQRKLYLMECALAIAHLHSMDILYRNLQDANVLIGSDGHIRLGDFGDTCDCAELAYCQLITETSPFTAPEIVMRRETGSAADWWSLGVLSFLLFVGKLPFEGANQTETDELILNAKLKIPAVINTSAASFIAGLLQKKPEKRLGYTNDDDVLNHEFFSVFERARVLKKEYPPDYIPDEPSRPELAEFHENWLRKEGGETGPEIPSFEWDSHQTPSAASSPR